MASRAGTTSSCVRPRRRVSKNLDVGTMRVRTHTGVTIGLLFLYWLVFVWLAVDWAHNPGYVMNRENVPYPVRDVVFVSGFVGLLVGALGLFLLWPKNWKRWARTGLCVAYVLVLVFLVLSGEVTDMPGIVYVPPAFAFYTLLLIGAFGLWRVVRRAVSSGTTDV